MGKIAVLMADGCEEIEALTVVDVLRRADMDAVTVSITEVPKVTGSHRIAFETDNVIADVDWEAYVGVVLPGGKVGTDNLGGCPAVAKVIKEFDREGKLVAAICAAPSVLGDNGILRGRKATSYPGFEDRLAGAKCCTEDVVRDGHVITSRGMGTAIAFALAIVSYYKDEETAGKLGESFMYR